MEKYLVSACLCGVNCKYNGKNNLNEKCLELFKQGRAILVCPEQLGGLKTPRDPSEIKGNKVISIENQDVTIQFQRGAEETLKIAKMAGIRKAILKEGSPSCGPHFIYDGSFKGIKIEGEGLVASLLRKNNIEVISSDNY